MFHLQVIGNRAPGLLTKVENLSIMQCIVLSKEENAPKSMIMAYWYDTSKNNEVLAASVTIQMEWTSPHEVRIVYLTAKETHHFHYLFNI